MIKSRLGDKMNKKISLFLLLCYLCVTMLPSYEAFATTIEYSVRAIIPDNQIDNRLTYFDLRMEPGQIQELSLTVQNSSNEEIQLMIEPNTALTNQNGVIDYSHHEIEEKDSSLRYSFSELISEKQLVTVGANETKEVNFILEMPDEIFDGIILGGFYIYQVNKEEPEQTVMLQNQFAFVIGVKLSMTDLEITPDLALNDIQSTLINYRTAVTANIQNTEATIINNLDVSAQITREGEKAILYETSRTGLSMAPNSNFDFPISLENQPIEAGQYQLYLTATNGEQAWEFERSFEIDSEIASELNQEAIELETDNRLLLYIGIVVGVMTVCMLGLWMKKKSNKQ